MEAHWHRNQLHSALPPEPLVGISNVAENMRDVNVRLLPAGLGQLVSFGHSYLDVTTTIDEQVEEQMASGLRYFMQPQVLHTATGKFNHKWTEPIRQTLNGEKVRPHWAASFEDERALFVDPGTQATLGYIAHIGPDLLETVHETATSGLYSPEVIDDYVGHDYFKIDKSLTVAAQKIAPRLVNIENPKARALVVKAATSGIALGRKTTLKDYQRLIRAKSEDEKLSIIHDSERRTAKIGFLVLGTSYRIHRALGKERRLRG